MAKLYREHVLPGEAGSRTREHRVARAGARSLRRRKWKCRKKWAASATKRSLVDDSDCRRSGISGHGSCFDILALPDHRYQGRVDDALVGGQQAQAMDAGSGHNYAVTRVSQMRRQSA